MCRVQYILYVCIYTVLYARGDVIKQKPKRVDSDRTNHIDSRRRFRLNASSTTVFRRTEYIIVRYIVMCAIADAYLTLVRTMMGCW